MLWISGHTCLGRGGFEQRLGQEDQECGIDQWVSDHGPGQQLWQILSQWVWNQRLWWGAKMQGACVRELDVELEAKLVPVEPVPLPVPAPVDGLKEQAPQEARDPAPQNAQQRTEVSAAAEQAAQRQEPEPDAGSAAASVQTETVAAPMALDPEEADARERFGPADFVLQPDGTVRCPAKQRLVPTERRQTRRGIRIRYEAPAKVCRPCPKARLCRGKESGFWRHGRRIALPQGPLQAPPAQPGRSVAPSLVTVGSAGPSPIAVGVPMGERLPRDGMGPWTGPTGSVLQAHGECACVPGCGTLPQALPESDAVPVWKDLPGSRLRRSVCEQLRSQRVQVEQVPPVEERGPSLRRLESRDERAHRRLTWAQRYQRNLLRDQRFAFRLHGLPPPLAQALEIRLDT